MLICVSGFDKALLAKIASVKLFMQYLFYNVLQTIAKYNSSSAMSSVEYSE